MGENTWNETVEIRGTTVTYGPQEPERGKPMPWWGYVAAPFVLAFALAAAPFVAVGLILVAVAALVVKFACVLCGWEAPGWVEWA
jgi:hypothetical protein